MWKYLAICLTIALTSCIYDYTAVPFKGVQPAVPLEAATYECKARSRVDLDKSVKYTFQSCMAEKGYKVDY